MIQKVRTSIIQSGAVVGNTIGPTSISSNNIVAGSITGNLIATNAVSGNNIGTNAICGNNIVAGTITGNLIANNTVTNSNLSEPNAFEDYFLLGLGS